MNIQQLIDSNNYEQVFRAFKSGQYYAELNRVLLTKSILVQYYYIKAIKEVARTNSNVWTIFNDFVEVTAPNKQIFRNILDNLYDDNNQDSLQTLHRVKDGLPPLQKFYDIALEVFKD